MRLICTVGESPIPVLIAVREFASSGALPVLTLLTSDKLKDFARDLYTRLRGLGLIAVGHSAEPIAYQSNLEVEPQDIQRWLDEHHRHFPADSVFDVTGGTKLMSIAVTRWARANGFSWQYINGLSGQVHRFSVVKGGITRQAQTYSQAPPPGQWLAVLGEAESNQPVHVPQAITDLAGGKGVLWSRGTFDGRKGGQPRRFWVWTEGSRIKLGYWLTIDEWKSLVDEVALIPRRLARERERVGGDFADLYWWVDDDYLDPLKTLPLSQIEREVLEDCEDEQEPDPAQPGTGSKPPQLFGYKKITSARWVATQLGIKVFGKDAEAKPLAVTQFQLPPVAASNLNHPAQVALLGDETVPIVIGSQIGSPRHIYLVTGEEKLEVASRVQRHLSKTGKAVRWIPVDPNAPEVQIGKLFATTPGSTLSLNTNSLVNVNLTGGTALMALEGDFCIPDTLPSFYLDGDQPIELRGYKRGQALRVGLSAEDYLELLGVARTVGGLRPDDVDIQLALPNLEPRTHKDDALTPVEQAFKDHYEGLPPGQRQKVNLVDAKNIRGASLEVAVYHALKELFGGYPHHTTDVVQSLEVQFPNGTTLTDLDVFAVVNDKALYVECKNYTSKRRLCEDLEEIIQRRSGFLSYARCNLNHLRTLIVVNLDFPFKRRSTSLALIQAAREELGIEFLWRGDILKGGNLVLGNTFQEILGVRGYSSEWTRPSWSSAVPISIRDQLTIKSWGWL